MRLSTRTERDDDDAVGVIHAALDAGATLLDTADAYCHDDNERGHNERLIARALSTWTGDRSCITVATKGGLTRSGGRWIPNGTAKHLAAACAASAAALGVDCIDLYQLHTIDPRTPLATSVRALKRLRAAGAIRDIGLCNVNLEQLEQALDITELAAVQVALNERNDTAVRGGLVEFCERHGIALIAHSPLAGPRKRRRITPELALAYWRDLSPCITPIPGATRTDTATSSVRAQTQPLGVAQRAELDAEYPAARNLRVPVGERRPADDAGGEVVLIVGMPGAGKSTAADGFVADGYQRLNRDERGGKLTGLLPALTDLVRTGARRVVLDNTYSTRAARNHVIETAWECGVPVRCVWLDTSLEQCQVNVVRRMVRRHGHLLAPDELARANKREPNTFGPSVLFRFRREFERPVAGEGFTAVERRPFVANDEGYTQRAIVFDRPGIELDEQQRQVVHAHEQAGYRCFTLPECPHGGGPPVCWCRKPLPGLVVELIEREQLSARESIYVGQKPADRALAERLGFRYWDSAQRFIG